jgi:mannose-6-phosphate isomerase-like protein (cupin superfamily)
MVFFTLPTVVGPGQGLDAPLGRLDTVHKVPSFVTEGRVAVIEHTLQPGQLAAPRHRHSREDELSIVLDGRLGARLGDDVVEAGAGSYVLKPRGQWHTFWNAGDAPLRVIEMLIPGESDIYLQRLSTLMGAGARGDDPAIGRLAAEYGIELDFDGVPELCLTLGLTL